MWSCKNCCGSPLPPERQLAAEQAQALTDLERRIAIPLFVAKMHGAKEPAIDRALAEALPAAMRLWGEVADPLCLILCPGGQGGDGRGLRQFPTTFEVSASRRHKEPTTRRQRERVSHVSGAGIPAAARAVYYGPRER